MARVELRCVSLDASPIMLRLRPALTGALLAGIAWPAMAQTAWTVPGPADWFDDANWNNGQPLAGDAADIGSGTAVIAGGGAATAEGLIAGNGQVTVTGAGSSWDTDYLTISGGTLVVENGGAVAVGLGFFDFGTLTVEGTGSSVITTDDFIVGRDVGPATLSVSDGARLVTNRAFFGEGANTLATSLSAEVTGPGSIWETTYFSFSGNVGVDARLLIADGGTMLNSYGVVGSGGRATVTVRGSGSQMLSGNEPLVLGIDQGGTFGQGRLIVEDGGLVSAGTLFVGGNGTGTTGQLDILGTAGLRGVVAVNKLTSGQGSAAVTFDGGILRAKRDNAGFIDGFLDGELVIASGGLIIDSDGFDVGAWSTLGGAGGLEKSGAGTLTFMADMDHAGGTTISGGVLQLGDGGTSGWILGDVTNDGVLAFNRSDAVTFDGVISGIGGVHQLGTGTTVLSADNSGLSGTSVVRAGVLSVGNVLGGTLQVQGGRLQGTGQVGSTQLLAGGTIAPGNSIGTLTIDGDYVGAGGTLEIETVLGGDASDTDRLVIGGSTSGSTKVQVINLGGGGAPTREGIRIVEVAGASDGDFTLLGSYDFNGEQAVVAGAYAYRLYKGGVSTPNDGDWYLRSALTDPPEEPVDPEPPVDPVDPEPPVDPVDPEPPTEPETPLYQAGAPIYEVYGSLLQAFNGVETMQQRLGNRAWASGVVDVGSTGVWARIKGQRADMNPEESTTGASYGTDLWQIQAGADGRIHAGSEGELTGGLSARYGTASAIVASVFGNGAISTTGYGLGGSLTWQGLSGFYVDGQAGATWYDSSLSSATAGSMLVSGNGGFGYAMGIEVGQQIALGSNWSVTPQAQLTYSAVDYEGFTDAFGSAVSLVDAKSLRGRFGISADYQDSWTDSSGQQSRLHAYGIANIHYEFAPVSEAVLSGVTLATRKDTLWGGIGAGGTFSWADGKYGLHGEIALDTSLTRPGRSYALAGTAGVVVKF